MGRRANALVPTFAFLLVFGAGGPAAAVEVPDDFIAASEAVGAAIQKLSRDTQAWSAKTIAVTDSWRPEPRGVEPIKAAVAAMERAREVAAKTADEGAQYVDAYATRFGSDKERWRSVYEMVGLFDQMRADFNGAMKLYVMNSREARAHIRRLTLPAKPEQAAEWVRKSLADAADQIFYWREEQGQLRRLLRERSMDVRQWEQALNATSLQQAHAIGAKFEAGTLVIEFRQRFVSKAPRSLSAAERQRREGVVTALRKKRDQMKTDFREATRLHAQVWEPAKDALKELKSTPLSGPQGGAETARELRSTLETLARRTKLWDGDLSTVEMVLKSGRKNPRLYELVFEHTFEAQKGARKAKEKAEATMKLYRAASPDAKQLEELEGALRKAIAELDRVNQRHEELWQKVQALEDTGSDS